MKRIIFFMFAMMFCTPFFLTAQKAINERDVPETILKDFKQKEPEAVNVKWSQLDSVTYEASFASDDGKKSIRFSNVSTETRWEVDTKWAPSYIKTYVENAYTKGKIESVCIADIKGKKYYEALVKQKKDQFLLTFGLDGILVSSSEIKKKK